MLASSIAILYKYYVFNSLIPARENNGRRVLSVDSGTVPSSEHPRKDTKIFLAHP